MTNIKSTNLTNEIKKLNNQNKTKFDLEHRTTLFAKNTLVHCSKEKVTLCSRSIIEQLIRSSTSIGANYREANGADSKNDFRNKICICKKEAKETMYWIELLSQKSVLKDELRLLWKEACELSLIFGAITRKLRSPKR